MGLAFSTDFLSVAEEVLAKKINLHYQFYSPMYNYYKVLMGEKHEYVLQCYEGKPSFLLSFLHPSFSSSLPSFFLHLSLVCPTPPFSLSSLIGMDSKKAYSVRKMLPGRKASTNASFSKLYSLQSKYEYY